MATKIRSSQWIGTLGSDNDALGATNDFISYYGLAGDDTATAVGSGQFLLGAGADALVSTYGGIAAAVTAYGAEGPDTLNGGANGDWLYGGSGSDSVSGGGGADVLVGDGLDLPLSFCDPPDVTLVPGADTLVGGDGDDVLVGAQLADRLVGGAGVDTFVFETTADYGDVIVDFNPNPGGDRLFFNSLVVATEGTTAGQYVTFTPSGGDTLVFLDRDGPAGAYAPQQVATLQGISIGSLDASHLVGFTPGPLALGSIYSVTSEWADTVSLQAQLGQFAWLYTLGGNDVVTSDGFSYVALGHGDDRFTSTMTSPFPPGIELPPGFELPEMPGGLVWGGRGADTLVGAAGMDQFFGGSGADSITGGGANDQLFGDCTDPPIIFAGSSDDFVQAPGADTLDGGDGKDLLVGGGGADHLRGGAGSDLFVYENASEFGDTIWDFQVGPTGDRFVFAELIEAQAAPGGAYVTLSAAGGDTQVFLDRDGPGGAYAPQLVATLMGVSIAQFDAFQLPGLVAGTTTKIEPYGASLGSEWADTLSVATTTDDSYQYYLLAGDDTVTSASAGTYNLGRGNDRFTSTITDPARDVNVNGAQGDDTLAGSVGEDLIHGGSGADAIQGGGGDDELYGDCVDGYLAFCDDEVGDEYTVIGGADSIDGGAGDDVIVGGAGADLLTGGAGSDLFVFEDPSEFGDTITDFQAGSSGDRLLLTGFLKTVTAANVANYVSVQQAGADLRVFVDRDAGEGAFSAQLVATLTGVQAGQFSLAQNALLGESVGSLSAPAADLVGTQGPDQLVDTQGARKLFGLGGNDLLTGGPGNDTLDGGAGRDQAFYGGPRARYDVSLSNGQATVADTAGTDGIDTLTGVERARFADLGVAFDIDGIGGQAYRIYQAAFARKPDLGGLGFWMASMDGGTSLLDVARGFLGSQEFKQKYGANPTNEEYVRALYQNVLGRDPDQGGYDYWNSVLNPGLTTREKMLVDFSESAENVALVGQAIGNGFDYQPYGA